MVVCIRVRAPRRDWVLFRSIVSQTNGVHVVSSEDIMFRQTGRTNRKWTAVSFTLRDKYGLSRRLSWRNAPIIPAVSSSPFQHRESFDSESKRAHETFHSHSFFSFTPEYYSLVIRAAKKYRFLSTERNGETISSSLLFNPPESFLIVSKRNPDCIEYEFSSKRKKKKKKWIE